MALIWKLAAVRNNKSATSALEAAHVAASRVPHGKPRDGLSSNPSGGKRPSKLVGMGTAEGIALDGRRTTYGGAQWGCCREVLGREKKSLQEPQVQSRATHELNSRAKAHVSWAAVR